MSLFDLRAAAPTDEPFLRELFATTRESLLRSLPFTPAQRDAFCDMQFRAQAVGYRAAYPQAEYLVVTSAQGTPIGRLTRASQEAELVLVDIALMPEFRGRGIGGALIGALQREAASRGIALVLSVEASNPALALYRRMGFEVVDQDGMRLRMRWQPTTSLQGGREEWSLMSEK